MTTLGRRPPLAVLVVVAAALALTTLTGLPAQAARLDLHLGSRGTQVHTLERRLEVLRLLAHRHVDRRYTSSTASSVRTFQRTRHLRVTGRVDQRTWDRVARDAARRSTPSPTPTPTPTPTPSPPTGPPPTIVGHRGAATSGVGENTLAAMEWATGYADVLEFDVRFTADGVPVLMHDATLDRTTTCTGPLDALTAQQLREQCRVRAQDPSRDQPVPTLDEAAAYAESARLAVSPKLKTPTVTDAEIDTTLRTLEAHGLGPSTWLQSFHPAVLAAAHARRPALHLVLLASSTADPTPQAVLDAGAGVVGLTLGRTTTTAVTTFHAAGLRVWSWTAATTEELTAVWRTGADGVFTDIPRDARALYHP